MPVVKRILVAVKQPDAKVLPAPDKAAQLARAFRAQIELFHAIPTPLASARIAGASGAGMHGPATHRMTLKHRLERLAGRIRKQGITVDTHVGWDFPIAGIAATAEAVGSSIIVMGAISRSGLERLFIGNTAEQILDSIQCDVLVVKAA